MGLFIVVFVVFIFGILVAALIQPKKRNNENVLYKEYKSADSEIIGMKSNVQTDHLNDATIEHSLEHSQILIPNQYREEEEIEQKGCISTELVEWVDTIGKLEEKLIEENVEPESFAVAIQGKIRKSRILTMNEQPIFRKLRETLEPEYTVLSQVSFSAILWTYSRAVRNRFNRKIVDFVVCDQAFNVIAVIELDDSSHNGQEKRDAERDLLFQEAGIKVIRYRNTPESWRIKQDVQN